MTPTTTNNQPEEAPPAGIDAHQEAVKMTAVPKEAEKAPEAGKEKPVDGKKVPADGEKVPAKKPAGAADTTPAQEKTTGA